MLQDKENLATFVDITAHILVTVYNPDTGTGEEVHGVTAIDFLKNTVSYIDMETGEKKTTTGDIFLFINKESLGKKQW